MKLRLYIVLVLLLGSLLSLSAEIRAVWVTPWNIKTPTMIDTLLQHMSRLNQTEIVAEVRYRADALYIPNRVDHTYPVSDPRSYILEGSSFDPLAYLLEQSKLYGIRVQAWVTMMNFTPVQLSVLPSTHVYYKNPEWMTLDNNHGIMAREKYTGLFLDPGVPQVQDYLTNMVLDLAVNYPELSGIHLDYIRYPHPQFGHNLVAEERYKSDVELGYSGTWQQWKEEQINTLVKRIYTGLKQVAPQMELTAAVMADPEDARVSYAQNWPAWVNGGYIDRVYLMNYASNDLNFEKITQRALATASPDKIVNGLRSWSSGTAYPFSKLLSKIRIARQYPCAGLCLFSYEGILANNYMRGLEDLAFSTPANPSTVLAQDTPVSPKELRAVSPFADTTSFHSNGATSVNASQTPNESVESALLGPTDNLNISNKVEADKQAANDSEMQPIPISTRGVEVITKQELPKFQIVSVEDQIQLRVYNPISGRLSWMIKDSSNKAIYHKYVWYESGVTDEYWNGILDNGDLISDGDYTIVCISEMNKQEISFPLNLKRILND